MKHHKYLIIGGGMTAAAAISGIREVDPSGDIGMISTEPNPPYDRPPLSKHLWTGKKSLADIWRPVPADVPIYGARTVVEMNLGQKQATDQQGDVYSYDRLLLATGGRPRRLPFGDDHIIYFRTVDTYQRLNELAQKHDRFAVIGGGFIGSELAAALAINSKQVTMLFPGGGIGERMFPADLSSLLNDYYRERGVEVLTGQKAVGLEGEGTDLTLLTDQGRRLSVNGIVAGIGIQPNVELAQAAGLDVHNGILVNQQLRATHPDVFAAGDVAAYPDALLGETRRVEHEDAANTMGRAAGRAMAGAEVLYEHSPMFYSDLFELGYEAVGELNSRLETVSDWQEPYRKGIVYYLEDHQVRGVLLWDVWGQVEAARRIMAERAPLSRESLLGQLPG